MLWTAGQERMVRESRERLTELFATTRDGYVAGNVAIGRAVSYNDSHIPAYARPDRPVQRDPAAQRATLARLGRMFPGAITRAVS